MSNYIKTYKVKGMVLYSLKLEQYMHKKKSNTIRKKMTGIEKIIMLRRKISLTNH